MNFILRLIRKFLSDPERYLKLAVEIVNLIKQAVNSGNLSPDVIPKTDMITESTTKAALRETLAEVGLPWKNGTIDAQVMLYDIPRKERKAYWKAIAGGIHSRLANVPLETSIVKVEDYYKATKPSQLTPKQ